jgi:hypothetical protein
MLVCESVAVEMSNVESFCYPPKRRKRKDNDSTKWLDILSLQDP